MLFLSIRTLGFTMCQVILKSFIVESGFHKTPSNVVAVVGQVIRVSCWTNPGETTLWFFRHQTESVFSLVYNSVSDNFTPRFSVNKSAVNGHHDLTVKNVRMTDAGFYKCVVLSRETQNKTTPISATAELIVLDSDPECSTNISKKDGSILELDYVEFRCAINFSGQWTPSIQWSDVENTFNTTPILFKSNMARGVRHLTSLTVFRVSAENNGMMIICNTKFCETSKTGTSTNATNIPSYLFRWNVTLNVHFGARNATITPRKIRYSKEDVLNCTALGNPSPTFLWRSLRTHETIAIGPQLMLNTTRRDADQRYTIECIAQNHVAGELKLSSATVDDMIEENWQLPIGYIVGAGVGICCTMVTVFVAKCIQKKLTSKNSRDREAKENAQDPSPDLYDSIYPSEVSERPSTSTAAETAVRIEYASDDYNALAERPIMAQHPDIYSTLEANADRVAVLSTGASERPSIYVNCANE